MSYITDIEQIFTTIEPSGTFLFSSEVRADDTFRNVPNDAQPFFVIDDEPLITNTRINIDSSAQDNPLLKIYTLTNFDLSSNEVNENNSTRIFQHENCVLPMKDLAIRVMAKYFREGSGVLRENNVAPQFVITDKYNLWSKMLYGVELSVRNLNIQRLINYCDV